MNQQENDYPSLGGVNNQNQKESVPDTWEQDIPKQDPPKKKTKLKLGSSKLNFNAQEFDPSKSFQPQGNAFGGNDFLASLNPQQQQQPVMDLGAFGQFGAPQDNAFDAFFQPQQPQEDPIYSMLDNSQYKRFGGQYHQNTIQDQFGNLFELEKGQYLENGQIFLQEDNNEQDDFWDNYKGKDKKQQQQQNKQQKKTGKVQEKKAGKPQKVTIQPKKKVPVVLTDEQKLAKELGNIRQQTKFTVKELQEKELALMKKEEAYTKVDIERESLNLVFIGHVDAGKSTLSGRILIDTNEIDEKTVKNFEEEAKKNGREGWYMAYAMDENEDERSKGKTVETGKAFFQLSKRRFTLLDAPGHKNYVPNMIAGACQSDMACLIISAKSGEFESGFEKGGQTTEHVQLIRALGVQKLVCVISKMDTCNWSQDRYNYITKEFGPWLKRICDFDNVEFIPINAFDSQNVSKRVDPGICSWYSGPSLFEYLNTVKVPKREPEAPVRIPILDVQKEEGKLYCYGKIESGSIYENLWLTVMPHRKDVQISEIFDAKDRKLAYATAGENVKFRIKDTKSEDELQRGFIICSTDSLCGVSSEYIAEVQLLELPEQKSVMSSGYQCILHMHTTVLDISVTEVQAIYDKSHGKFIKSPIIKSGDKGIIKIDCEKLLCLEKFENVPYLGRFTLRDENQTIAYGTVKKFRPALEFQRILAKQAKESQQKK